jgi:hypothetical protein
MDARTSSLAPRPPAAQSDKLLTFVMIDMAKSATIPTRALRVVSRRRPRIAAPDRKHEGGGGAQLAA